MPVVCLSLRAAPLSGSRLGQRRKVAARAAAEPKTPQIDELRGPFNGRFGTWRIEPEDELEVFAYRASLALVAASFGAGTLGAVAHVEPLQSAGTLLAAAGAAGMGAAVVLIHVYLAPMKRLLQALLAAGVAGGVYLAATNPGVPLPEYVAAHPGAVWLVGPAFASLTGIAVKEGFCFGRGESLALSFLVPALLLGHLSGVLPEVGEQGLSVAVAALLAVFAGNKIGQPVKDDIGDKSVFEFFKLPEEQRQAKLEAMQRAGMLGDE